MPDTLPSTADMKHPKTSKSSVQVLKSNHKDYIQFIAFDHYGRRIATCSGDRTVKIWDLDDNGEFSSSTEGSEWKAHHSGVTSLSWSHPEFGQLLATGGADGFANIWEERAEGGFAFSPTSPADHPASSSSSVAGGGSVGPSPTTRWIEKGPLSDARKALSCVKFAPRHLRLQLATASADGFVRIYEAVDVMNLNQWVLLNNIEVENDSELGVRCLDWCTGRFEPPTLVVGGSSGNVSIYRYSDASRSWGLYVRLEGHVSPRRGVLDVAWAPNVGRSYHLIGSCGRDGVLRVHKLKRVRNAGSNAATTNKTGQDKNTDHNNDAGMMGLELESSQILDVNGAEVWRCAWNVTGTVLASSGDAGVVQLWKSDFRNQWKAVSEIHGDISGHASAIMS